MKKILQHITAITLIVLLAAFSSGFMLHSITCYTSGKTFVKVGNNESCCKTPQTQKGTLISKKCCEKSHQTLDLTDFVSSSDDSKAPLIATSIDLIHFFQSIIVLEDAIAIASNSPPIYTALAAQKHTLLQQHCTFLI